MSLYMAKINFVLGGCRYAKTDSTLNDHTSLYECLLSTLQQMENLKKNPTLAYFISSPRKLIKFKKKETGISFTADHSELRSQPKTYN